MIQSNKYYFTTPDNFRGHMRKTLIFIVKVTKKCVFYKIADWRANIDTGEEIIEVLLHYKQKGRCLISEAESCFGRIKDESILESTSIKK